MAAPVACHAYATKMLKSAISGSPSQSWMSHLSPSALNVALTSPKIGLYIQVQMVATAMAAMIAGR